MKRILQTFQEGRQLGNNAFFIYKYFFKEEILFSANCMGRCESVVE